MSDAAPAGPEAGSPARRWLADGRILWACPILCLCAPLLFNQYVLYILDLVMIYCLVGIGFNIVLGNLGQLAFANAAFFGIGAYATGILMYHLRLPFLLAGLAGGVAGALAGGLVSLPALRGVRGFSLAIMTLAFGELMRWVYVHAPSLTLGSTGLPVPLPTVFGVPLRTDGAKYYLFLAVLTLLAVMTSGLLRSRAGRAFMAIRENELAAAAMGIPTARYIVLAFMWSGFVVGIAGSLYAALVRRVSPDAFDLAQLLLHFGIVMVGGLGSIAGSILGAIALTAAPELIRDLPGFEAVFIAGLIIVALLFLPRGLASLAARIVPALASRYHRRTP